MKAKLSIDNQISHMRDVKGIKFNIIGEDAAKEFLVSNNYFFKIKSYAKNYDKYNQGQNKGKYINLEFAYLQELSTLDMHFRKFIIKISLDIEHFLKTQLLKDFSGNNNEDGYQIINDLFQKYPYIKQNIESKENYSVCADIIAKYKDQFAIWNIVEVISFGDFIKLYNEYYSKYEPTNKIKDLLWSIKFLRNAAAHNNCLLNSLASPYHRNKSRINNAVNNYVSRIPGISKEARIKKMSNPIIHDFIVTLYVFMVVCSPKVKEYTMKELKELIDERCTRNKDYFSKNNTITSYYHFVKKIVDYLYGQCI